MTEIAQVPVAVVMIALNEAVHMEAVLENIIPWAQEIFLVDSYSSDGTVDIALKHGVHVVQRRFKNFGDQWNFAVTALPIQSPWTMKLDPDERLTDELKSSIAAAIRENDAGGLNVQRRLWFLGRPMPVRQELLRLWRTGTCRFSEVLVNEHPSVSGRIRLVSGELEHYDSPNLHHWYEKQNRYTTAEAITSYRGAKLSAQARLFGTPVERRMWFKRNFFRLPGFYATLFLYNYFVLGAWRAGRAGLIWARLRVEVYRAWEYKLREMQMTGREAVLPPSCIGTPDPRVPQY
jgi:glycosyltransferase involved in cell wall biosynthesis